MKTFRALLVAALVPVVAAADFSSDYEKGVEALKRGRAAAAVALLQSAIRARPQPGENIITYGTNRLARYHPYLQLAEAHLQLGQVEEAQRALDTSERYAKEPAADRAQLRGRLQRAQQAAQATPPPTPPPATPEPRPAVVAATPIPAPTPAPQAVATPVATPTPVVADARPTTRPATAPATPAAVAPALVATPAPVAAGVEPGSLAIVSEPPAAAVYLDDEPLGVTDPQTGRLYKSGVKPGRHRLRLARADHHDWTTEVDVEPGSLQTIRGALVAAPSTLPLRNVAIAVGALLAAIAGLLLARRRAPVVDARESTTVAPTKVLDRPAPTPAARKPTWTPARTHRPAATQAADMETRALNVPDGAEAFGAYVLLEQLGRGGMASVFRAERNGETCALKRPLPGFVEDPEFLERFLREAEIGRTLHHPNIIRIHDRGDVDGVPYFTMELVSGETLHALLRRHGAFAPREATRIVIQVAEALDYAHLKGVVHRDLKPSNIMMLADGTVKVMDYGIARARRFEGLTVTGAFLGTPEYVAPETASGKGTDARSDLYALGVVFYELLTGKRPFSGDNAFATIQKHCTEPPTPPSLVNPGTPRELEAAILKLLRKDPDERYPDAEALLLDLRDYLNRAA